jgi:hypothetical protein
MKKTFLKLSFYSLILFSVTSCGSSAEDDTKVEVPEVVEEEEPDFSAITSAEKAMDEYKSLLEEYSNLVESGDEAAAAELKEQLDELKSFAEGKFGSDELKALSDLTSLAAKLEAGEMVDLGTALEAYDKSLEVLEDMPMDAETREALDASQEAMQGLEGLGGY